MCNIRIRVKKNHKDQLHSKKSDLNDHWLCGDCDLLYAGCKVIENQIYLILVSVIVSGLVYAVVLILMKNTVITDVLERFVRGARG